MIIYTQLWIEIGQSENRKHKTGIVDKNLYPVLYEKQSEINQTCHSSSKAYFDRQLDIAFCFFSHFLVSSIRVFYKNLKLQHTFFALACLWSFFAMGSNRICV